MYWVMHFRQYQAPVRKAQGYLPTAVLSGLQWRKLHSQWLQYILYSHNNHWLVVCLPLWKICESIGMIIPNIWENKNVPNHQPDHIYANVHKCTNMVVDFLCLMRLEMSYDKRSIVAMAHSWYLGTNPPGPNSLVDMYWSSQWSTLKWSIHVNRYH